MLRKKILFVLTTFIIIFFLLHLNVISLGVSNKHIWIIVIILLTLAILTEMTIYILIGAVLMNYLLFYLGVTIVLTRLIIIVAVIAFVILTKKR
jgi:hypothetical protein